MGEDHRSRMDSLTWIFEVSSLLTLTRCWSVSCHDAHVTALKCPNHSDIAMFQLYCCWPLIGMISYLFKNIMINLGADSTYRCHLTGMGTLLPKMVIRRPYLYNENHILPKTVFILIGDPGTFIEFKTGKMVCGN